MLSAVQVMSGSVELDQEDDSMNIGPNGELQMAKDIDQHGRAGALDSKEGAASTYLGVIEKPGTCATNGGDMDKCVIGTETECSSWSNGLSSGQKLAFGAAIKAAGGRLASVLPPMDKSLLQRPTHRHINRADSTAPVITEHRRSQQKKSIVRSDKVRGASLAETSDAKACVDPANADPATWCCECWATAQSQCEGVNEGCIHRLMCNNPNICPSWKRAQPQPCGPVEPPPRTNGDNTGTDTSLMLQRSQSNTESDGTRTGNIDHSMVGKCDSEDR